MRVNPLISYLLLTQLMMPFGGWGTPSLAAVSGIIELRGRIESFDADKVKLQSGQNQFTVWRKRLVEPPPDLRPRDPIRIRLPFSEFLKMNPQVKLMRNSVSRKPDPSPGSAAGLPGRFAH